MDLLDLLDGDARHLLDQTRYAQIGVVGIQVALVASLRAAGIRPDVVAAHSLGEPTAARAADVLTLPDLLRLTALRGELMQAPARHRHDGRRPHRHPLAHGRVGGVPGIEIAAHNAPRVHTVSGPEEVMARPVPRAEFLACAAPDGRPRLPLRLHHGTCQSVTTAPGYPFQRRRFWITPTP